MAWMVLMWAIFKIVSSDPDLHPRWPPYFPIGSYVKILSTDGSHFEPRSGSLNTILEVDHLRTIDDMFALLAYWFQRRRFKKKIPIGSYVKTTVCPLKAGCPPSADIVLT
jgi:hypothetical protein